MTETSFTGRSEAIPTANPAVVLHGGQGSGCTMGVRRYFDPSAYRIVLFDQRGAAGARRTRAPRTRTSALGFGMGA